MKNEQNTMITNHAPTCCRKFLTLCCKGVGFILFFSKKNKERRNLVRKEKEKEKSRSEKRKNSYWYSSHPCPREQSSKEKTLSQEAELSLGTSHEKVFRHFLGKFPVATPMSNEIIVART